MFFSFEGTARIYNPNAQQPNVEGKLLNKILLFTLPKKKGGCQCLNRSIQFNDKGRQLRTMLFFFGCSGTENKCVLGPNQISYQ
jgi:hypothetical protein